MSNKFVDIYMFHRKILKHKLTIVVSAANIHHRSSLLKDFEKHIQLFIAP